MLVGEEVHNIFTNELNRAFLMATHVVDYAVMKYVGSSCAMLTEQEYLHAKNAPPGREDRQEAR